METVKLTFLGTGSAIPTKKHNHIAILASFANENILFDCGEGTQRQFKFAETSPTCLTKIIISHWHGDHMLGLPGLFQTLAMSDYQKTLKIYGPRGIKRYIQIIQELITGVHINLEVHEIEGGKFLDEKDFYVEAAPMNHGTPTLAYSLVLKDKIRLNKAKLKKLKLPNSPIIKDLQKGKDIIFNGKKIKAKDVTYKEEGKKITLVLDTAYNEQAISLAKESDLLICESTFLENSENGKELAREYKHLTASQAGQIAKKSKSKKLLLAHISQRYENIPKIVENEAKKIFKNTKIMNDLDSLTL